MKVALHICLGICLFISVLTTTTSAENDDKIRSMIEQFKKEARGPYQAIRWFCPDGSIIPAKERCKTPGGIQHALHRNDVQALAKNEHVFLGQILAGTDHDAFWDASNRNSRAIQYQIEQFLMAADNGWVLRKAQFYRGAKQAEDETAWGAAFLTKQLSDDDKLSEQFFLLRELSDTLPFESGDDESARWQRIRLLSKQAAEQLPEFMDIRIKIHGQPDESDLPKTREFLQQWQRRMQPDTDALIQSLIAEMEIAYAPFEPSDLKEHLPVVGFSSDLSGQLSRLIGLGSPAAASREQRAVFCEDLALLLWVIRLEFPGAPVESRLKLMSLSLRLERLLFRYATQWRPQTIGGEIRKAAALMRAAAGCGYLEIWEWQELNRQLEDAVSINEVTLDRLLQIGETYRRAVEWGTGMIRAVYGDEITRYSRFEPLVLGFPDDLIRSSVLLPLGDTAGEIGELAAGQTGISNQVLGIANQNQVRGINPGFAIGEMVVMEDVPENFAFSNKKIYVLLHPPADLKPVAGIATVSAGNLVSHVQLLARNLGIPNAVLSQQNLNELKSFNGQKVFYAVSPFGKVIMKPADQMTSEERALLAVKKRSDERIRVPLDNLQLERTDFVSLRELRATDSGKICGPKAANLGELKSLFPERVVEGFIVPFGVFRQHMEQTMPGLTQSYWQFLQSTFSKAAEMTDAAESETFILARLDKLSNAITEMPFLPEFEQTLETAFRKSLGAELGRKAVFIRSDTNMEDLSEFTGAGLNLTVFNVASRQAILAGIRRVWASPYSERSYRWRQQYLLNPENVYPSILILPTVPVSKSGVLITTGISSGVASDLTIAFSRGPGGAVDGQAAETYLLKKEGANALLSPSRDRRYNVLPAEGGAIKGLANFNTRILRPAELQEIRALADELKEKLPNASGMHSSGPYDVEFGYLDSRIVLFQVRPFVENKLAQSSGYLNTLDSGIKFDKKVRLDVVIAGKDGG